MNVKHIKYYSLLHNLVFAGAVIVAMGCGSLVVFTKRVAEREAAEQAITNFLAEQPLKVLTNIRMDSIPMREL